MLTYSLPAAASSHPRSSSARFSPTKPLNEFVSQGELRVQAQKLADLLCLGSGEAFSRAQHRPPQITRGRC